MKCNKLILDSYDEMSVMAYRMIFNFSGIGISMLSTAANIRNYSSGMITKIETDY
jgi:hypothetical protein